MARHRWVDSRVQRLLDRLSRLSLSIDAGAAAEMINDRVDAVAAALRIGIASARRYVDDAAIDDLADRLADTVADELPGVDLLTEPRDETLDHSILGRTIEGLAEAILPQLTDIDETGVEQVRVLAQHISLLGAMLSESEGESIPLPAALIARAASQLERAAADRGISADLAAAFSRDARQLRDLTHSADETAMARVIDIANGRRPPGR
jgi:hypothetical protein